MPPVSEQVTGSRLGGWGQVSMGAARDQAAAGACVFQHMEEGKLPTTMVSADGPQGDVVDQSLDRCGGTAPKLKAWISAASMLHQQQGKAMPGRAQVFPEPVEER